MSEPTLAELMAQRAELERQFAQQMVGLLENADTRLKQADVADLLSSIIALRDAFPAGEPQTQLSNIVVVLSNVPAFIAKTLEDTRMVAYPPAAPEA